MSDDIVARLRIKWEIMTDMGNKEREEAADEIERLRSALDDAKFEVEQLLRESWDHGGAWGCFKDDSK